MTVSRRNFLIGSGVTVGLAGLGSAPGSQAANAAPPRPVGWVEKFDAGLDALIDTSAEMEVVANGLTWAEGPSWDRKRKRLYFSDVPRNIAYHWSRASGVAPFLDPSGLSDLGVKGFREPGANGLWYADGDHLLICNHGTRSVEQYSFATGERTRLASVFDGKKFNSPNDLVVSRDGTIYFTDPPYGLEGLDRSPLKEMRANGVYRATPAGAVERLLDDMTFPNGIGLSPDEKYLYVSQSDPEAPIIRRLGLDKNGGVVSDTIWFDARRLSGAAAPGLPDGMAVTADGYLFATGPGGVLILSPEGDLLGRLNTGRPTGNCVFGEDGSTLFITSDDIVIRVETKTRGVQWM